MGLFNTKANPLYFSVTSALDGALEYLFIT